MDDLAEHERRFRRAGLPLFIEDYSATEDVFTRAAPFLALVFVNEMFLAANWDWALWQSGLAVVGGFAILICAFGLLNLVRGRRLWALPEHVGIPELVGFVLIPAILPVIFGGQFTQAIGTVLSNAFVLLLAYLVVGYGLLAMLWWAIGRIGTQLATSLRILLRALPLLLIFSLVLFVNTEMWMVFHHMPRAFLGLVIALFVGVGATFLLLRAPEEVRAIERAAGAEGTPLTRQQRLNVGLVMVVSQSLQVLVVSLGMGAFFVVFGALAIGPEVQAGWDVAPDRGAPGWTTPPIFGHEVVITQTLLRVSAGIATFTGLYYAISVLTDSTYRKEFLEELTGEMRATFVLREDYLRLRAERLEERGLADEGLAAVLE